MPPNKPGIRKEALADAAAVRAVHEAAFPGVDEANIVDALRDANELSISLVATLDDQVVGHIAFSPITVNDAPAGLGLAPVAVRPDFQRCGIGSRLIEEGLRLCGASGAALVVVLGDPVYYSRFGFLPAAGLGLSDEYGGGDAFQAMILDNSFSSRGLVLYSSPLRVT